MKYKLGIIGIGKMGGSILSGIIKSKIYDYNDIILFDVSEEIKEKFTKEGFSFCTNEQELFDCSEKVIIAIKPQMFHCLETVNYKDNSLVIISIAAGKTIKDLQKIFGNQKYIRVMPNTPALIKKGATAISRTSDIDDETFEIVKKMFSSIGIDSVDELFDVIPQSARMESLKLDDGCDELSASADLKELSLMNKVNYSCQ